MEVAGEEVRQCVVFCCCCIIAGAAAPRLPNTVYALFPGVSGTELLARTPGLAASTGSACHDGHETPPQVLLEMGFPPERAVGAVRLSLGRQTTAAEVEAAAQQLIASWRCLRDRRD